MHIYLKNYVNALFKTYRVDCRFDISHFKKTNKLGNIALKVFNSIVTYN